MAYSSAKVHFFSKIKGLDLEWCKNCDKGLPKPDIVLYIDIEQK